MCHRRRAHVVLLALAVVALVGSAAAGAPAVPAAIAQAPKLTVTPTHVRQGGTVVLRGRGYAARIRLTLLAATPPGAPRHAIGSARTGLHGTFLAPIRIARNAPTGVYAVVACHGPCRRPASATFRILPRR